MSNKKYYCFKKAREAGHDIFEGDGCRGITCPKYLTCIGNQEFEKLTKENPTSYTVKEEIEFREMTEEEIKELPKKYLLCIESDFEKKCNGQEDDYTNSKPSYNICRLYHLGTKFYTDDNGLYKVVSPEPFADYINKWFSGEITHIVTTTIYKEVEDNNDVEINAD